MYIYRNARRGYAKAAGSAPDRLPIHPALFCSAENIFWHGYLKTEECDLAVVRLLVHGRCTVTHFAHARPIMLRILIHKECDVAYRIAENFRGLVQNENFGSKNFRGYALVSRSHTYTYVRTLVSRSHTLKFRGENFRGWF